MGPIKPAAKGGYVYFSTFTDDFTRMKEIFLLKSKDQAVDSLCLYTQTVAIPLGFRIQRVRADKRTKCISSAFQGFCNDSEIALGFVATVTPQHVGVSERDGRTIANIARCLLKDGNYPSNLWIEMFFEAVYNSNRSPYATLHSATPHFKTHGKEADVTGLRAIGARAFVHVETLTTKMGDKG